jgi:hypothetical protein
MVIQDSLVASDRVGVPGNDPADLSDLLPAGDLLGVGADDDKSAFFAVAEAGYSLREADLAVCGRQVVLLGLGVQPVPFGLADQKLGAAAADPEPSEGSNESVKYHRDHTRSGCRAHRD